MRLAGLITFTSFYFLFFPATAQLEACKGAKEIVDAINKHHVQPIPINDEWSKRVFDHLLTGMDPEKLLFTGEDIKGFRVYENTLDDDLHAGQACRWISTIEAVYKKRIQEHLDWLNMILSKPLEFSPNELFDFHNYPPDAFASNTKDLQARKNIILKYKVLMRMFHESSMSNFQKPLLTYEAVARQKIKNREMKSVEQEIKKAGGMQAFIVNCFYQSIAAAYDPHTDYFSYSAAQDFKAHISPTLFSFGFSITENQFGNMIISSVVPGGPAWVSNDIHDGDILLSIETAPGNTLNSMDYSIEEMWEQLNSQTMQTASIQVRKTDGQIKQVNLVKEKLASLENTVTGFLLKGDKNIGYIPLPSFYFDWNETSTASSGCANDVAKAIIKLKKEKLDGLILDLRFNGGGSVEEALNLAGIFIDYGPVGLIQEANTPIQVLKDMNKGTIFDGPLIIMVNGFSASASELLTASMQDYNRALVVGTRTFGKGTGQVMEPTKNGNPELTKSDFVKVTTSKIYRINGATYQHKGIRPAIILPDLSSCFSERESDLSYALPHDSVAKKVYYTPLPALTVSSLAEKSKARISQSTAFREVESMRSMFLQAIPLQPEKFEAYLRNIISFKPSTESKLYSISSSSIDESLLKVDSFKKEQTEKLVKDIETNFYIQEVYSIMLDHITSQKK